jgi:hypothetical protein
MSSIALESCITLQIRAQHSRVSCALHGRAGSSLSVSTTCSLAFLTEPDGSSRGYLDIDSFRAIRSCATERVSRHGAKHGYKINISIPRSIATPWPRCRAGFKKMGSNTCARIRAQCCVKNPRSCSPEQQTIGVSRAGWHSLAGSGGWGMRAGFSSPSAGERKSHEVRKGTRLYFLQSIVSPPFYGGGFQSTLLRPYYVRAPEVSGAK